MTDTQFAVRPEISELRELYQRPETVFAPESLISVSPTTAHAAAAYERFRNTLEPAEGDILRRGAIRRILHRRLSEDRPPAMTALSLIQELIRARYIEPLPQQFVNPIADYIKLGQWGAASLPAGRIRDSFIRLVTVSIDRILYGRAREEALVHFMYHDTFYRLGWLEAIVLEAQRPAQVFIACQRALFAADQDEIIYHYFVNTHPSWQQRTFTQEQLEELLKKWPDFFTKMQELLQHPAAHRLERLLRPVAVPYRLLSDLLAQSSGNPWSDRAALGVIIRVAVGNQAQDIRARMSRRAWHSIWFLLFTKSFLTLLAELPYELFLLRQVHVLALATNIVFHPLLLFFLSTTARLPGERNTERIVQEITNIVTGDGELPTIVIAGSRHHGPLTWTIFALVYVILFVLMFWGLFIALDRLHFSLLGIGLFVVFFGLVSFLSARIRRMVDQIRLWAPAEGLFATLIGFISLPMLEFGRWLTIHISQLNVFLFLMDHVLEAPFKLLIDVVEDWFIFVKDRREEII